MTTTHERGTSRAPGPVVVAVLGLAALAWVAVVLTHGSSDSGHAGGHAGMHGAMPGEAGDAHVPGLVVTLAGWTLMVAAMMLPPALPLVAVLAGLLAGRAGAWRHQVVAVAAFVAVWVVSGVVLLSGAAGVGLLVERVPPGTQVRVTGAVVLLAGLYQFTPVRNACLTACRSPRWFAMRYWRGRGPARDSAALAAAYGASCVGCCWALMLLCLGTGALALPVMVVLAAVMAAERLVRRGRLVARATGAALVVLGAAMLADLLPAVVVHALLGI